jgi:hypothetical protein
MGDSKENRGERKKKAPDRKPETVHSEQVKVRAVLCNQDDDRCGPNGPITGGGPG